MERAKITVSKITSREITTSDGTKKSVYNVFSSDGKRFSAWFKPDFNAGDTVEFDYSVKESKDGQHVNFTIKDPNQRPSILPEINKKIDALTNSLAAVRRVLDTNIVLMEEALSNLKAVPRALKAVPRAKAPADEVPSEEEKQQEDYEPEEIPF